MNYIEPRLLKGFRDYNPSEQIVRQRMMVKIQNAFERFGFMPMSTPVLEYKDILMGKYGEDEKLIYNFTDNGEREVAMRYDLTVPFARFVAMNKGTITYPFKRYQMGPVWRADNPQKGRLREFVQCDIDVIGSDSMLADVEILSCVAMALDAIGIDDYKLRINTRELFNTLGSVLVLDNERAIEVVRAIDKVKKIGNEGVIEILREKKIPESVLPQVEEFLNLGEGDKALAALKTVFNGALADLATKIEALFSLLEEQGVRKSVILFDPSIARGLDYYTGFVFEVTLDGAPDFGSVGSGGRYDNLLKQFSEESLPAVGGSIGLDRIFGALESLGRLESPELVKVMVFNIDASLQTEYLTLATRLRSAGINTEVYYQTTKLDKQFKYAEAKKIPYAVIVGGDEAVKNVVQVKNMATREQQLMDIDKLCEMLSN